MYGRAMARPRKSGARSRSGRLSRAHITVARDHGTPEGVRNRGFLVNGSPVELAGSAIGVLLANGHIELEQVRAAERYRRAYSSCFGLPIPKASQALVEPYTPRANDRSLARALVRFEELAGRLGRDQKQALDHLVIDGRIPHWFRMVKLGRLLRPEDEAERSALLSGLAALVG
jgi:hypothetical protein